MKSILITSAVSIVIGFAGGWMIKSASQELETVEKVQRIPTARPDANPSFNPDTNPLPTVPARPMERPEETTENIATAEINIPESAAQFDKAKWLRLSEVLGLDPEQSKALAANIEESRPNPAEGESLDIAYERAGEQLQQRILAILTPEQQEEFRKFQQRAMDNKVELTAQKSLSDELGNLDLTTTQREQALDFLRVRAETEVSAISPATRLTLSGSILPIGNEKFTEESILLLRKIGSNASMADLAQVQRAEIEDKMKNFEGILTPGQLESYRANLNDTLRNLDIISPPK